VLARAILRLVHLSLRAPGRLLLVCLIGATLLGGYVATHFNIDADTNKLISPDLPWRQREAQFEKAFPQNVDLIAIVIDAKDAPGQAEDAAAALAQWASSHPELFKTARRPDGGEFFTRNGLLFLPVTEAQQVADQLIASQPLLGQLAADPSLRGLFSAIDLALQGVTHGDIKLAELDAPLNEIGGVVEAAVAGRPHHLSWQGLFTGRSPTSQELRRFVLVQPILDYQALEPGATARDAIHQAAAHFGLTPDQGVTVRLTGPVALSDEEFATVTQGAGGATIVSLALVCLILFMALRSWRIILAIVVTLLTGLVASAAFAFAAVGALNLISVAFAVLFIGIAVDFGIQFSVRYRDERYRADDLDKAILRTARGIGGPLFLASATTALGFYSFVPTDYSGVSELGLIAGTSMIIALFLNLTMLPATLKLLRPAGEPEPIGFAWAAGIDEFLTARRRAVLVITAVVAVGAMIALPHWRFDFDPLNLKDPHTESVSTLFDLMSDPSTTPYTIDILEKSVADAQSLAEIIEKLPEVAQVVSVASFVPEDQDEKIAILNDAQALLGPTLSPPATREPPDDAATLAALGKAAKDLAALAGAEHESPAARLARGLAAAVRGGNSILPVLNETIISGLPRRLQELRLSLTPQRATLETLPEDLKRAWVTPDGRARLEVFPKGDARDPEVLRRFVAAVRAVAPDATGTPVTIQESGDTVVGAFSRAGILAVSAITLLLLVVLRRVRDVLLVLGPLMLAGLLTGATAVLIGLPLNYANIITLPLLLGIGVAFDIYFVMRWRAGMSGPLQSSTARAVLFSALTTMTAFGSLALSSHPGTSEMGRLLTLALAYVLFCTLFVLPALLGRVRPQPAAAALPAPARR
jgi:hopanoid biosynthesis associated RND transporter like protein HpnN